MWSIVSYAIWHLCSGKDVQFCMFLTFKHMQALLQWKLSKKPKILMSLADRIIIHTAILKHNLSGAASRLRRHLQLFIHPVSEHRPTAAVAAINTLLTAATVFSHFFSARRPNVLFGINKQTSMEFFSTPTANAKPLVLVCICVCVCVFCNKGCCSVFSY